MVNVCCRVVDRIIVVGPNVVSNIGSNVGSNDVSNDGSSVGSMFIAANTSSKDIFGGSTSFWAGSGSDELGNNTSNDCTFLGINAGAEVD